MVEEKEKKTKKTAKKIVVQERESAENIEKIIVDLAKKGTSPSQIGIILKEKYGIQKMKVLGKKITKILDENKVEYKTDLDFVNRRISKINDHAQKNKQDKRAGRELVRLIGLKK